MAQIRRYPFLRHLRSEPTAHVLHYRRGRLARSGRGLAFWFRPLAAGIAEIPVDDREQAFLFRGRTADFQQVAVQGVVTYRVVEPRTTAERIDFGLDLVSGLYNKEPLEQLAQLVTQLAQQFAVDYLARTVLREVLTEGAARLRESIGAGLAAGEGLREMGIEVVAVRVSSVAPEPEMEKALQAPARESIQERADEATFQRRALAVEKERAIADNELRNKIELARREAELIAQHGDNEKRSAREQAAARKIEAEAAAERGRLTAAAEADGIRALGEARNEAERGRIAAYRDVPVSVLLGLAARELAGKLEHIDHLNLSPDALGPMLTHLVSAAGRRLESAPPAPEA